MSEHLHGMFPVSMLVYTFGLRKTEVDARNSVRNGVVKVNGKIVVNPDETFSLLRLNELSCGKHVIQVNRKG